LLPAVQAALSFFRHGAHGAECLLHAGADRRADGLSFALAYRYGKEGGEKSHTIGALIAYAF
jgi:hypothetical protein